MLCTSTNKYKRNGHFAYAMLIHFTQVSPIVSETLTKGVQFALADGSADLQEFFERLQVASNKLFAPISGKIERQRDIRQKEIKRKKIWKKKRKEKKRR